MNRYVQCSIRISNESSFHYETFDVDLIQRNIMLPSSLDVTIFSQTDVKS